MPEFGFSISAFSTWKNFFQHVWQPLKIIIWIYNQLTGILISMTGYGDPQTEQIWEIQDRRLGAGISRPNSDRSVPKSSGHWSVTGSSSWWTTPQPVERSVDSWPDKHEICTVQDWYWYGSGIYRWWNLPVSDIYTEGNSHSDYCFRVRILMRANRS